MNDEEFDRLIKKYDKLIEEGHELTYRIRSTTQTR